MSHSDYESPFSSRYSSRAMRALFGRRTKYGAWRKLWAALARAQMELGLPVTEEQVAELEATVEDVDFERAAELERETRHEVMAHIRAWGEQCPKAAPIIHLGATSAFVMDNTDLIQMREGLRLVARELEFVAAALARRAREYARLPVLGYTHFRPAQLTTLGKRITLWLQDFLWDLRAVRALADDMPFLGMKGATGTQASVVQLFGGDAEKAEELDRRIAERMGFSRTLIAAGQTYPRKVDSRVYAVLAGVAQSASKFAHDVRLMQHMGELMEPFGGRQVGSSAMPYKRNPMACERICGLSRFLISLYDNGAFTAATQWLERSLDDSSNKRVAMPQAFLAADAVLRLVWGVAEGFEVFEERIAANVKMQLPFMATEEILMEAVKRGGDRQRLHERLREHSLAAAERLARGAADNDLFARLAADPAFAAVRELLEREPDPASYVGLAPRQVERFLAEELPDGLPAPGEPSPWGGPTEV
ncbi:MAG: adenylosuccinate lyase [Planctomycetota bacterium]|nr:MAG: adenylosuccinate lyase [Planctomycetota bacterium]